MPRRKLTETELTERILRRAGERDAAAARVAANRDWHERRKAAAEKRRAKIRAARDKAAAKLARKQAKADKGRPVVDPMHRVSKHKTPIDSTLGEAVVHGRRIVGNHDYRRAVGQRSHFRGQGDPLRKPRRRELPAAQARRLERARKAWTS